MKRLVAKVAARARDNRPLTMTSWGSMDEYLHPQPRGQASSGDGGLPAQPGGPSSSGDGGLPATGAPWGGAEHHHMAGSESEVMSQVSGVSGPLVKCDHDLGFQLHSRRR